MIILVVGFSESLKGLRVDAILDIRSIHSDENDLPPALDRELGIWTGINNAIPHNEGGLRYTRG